MSNAEVKEIIDDRVNYMIDRSQEWVEEFGMQYETVTNGAFQNVKSLKEYDLQPTKSQKDKHWNINSFKSIGWVDPFPKKIQVGKFSEPKLKQADI